MGSSTRTLVGAGAVVAVLAVAAVVALVRPGTPESGSDNGETRPTTCETKTICGWVTGNKGEVRIALLSYPRVLEADTDSFDKVVSGTATVAEDGWFEVSLEKPPVVDPSFESEDREHTDPSAPRRSLPGTELYDLAISDGTNDMMLPLSESGFLGLIGIDAAQPARFDLATKSVTGADGEPLDDPPVVQR